MASPQPLLHDPKAEALEGRSIIRRFTDELAGSNGLERSTKAAQAEMDEEEETKELSRLRLLYESPANGDSLSRDFIASDIARETLQKMVNKFVENEKPSMLQRMGISHKSTKSKANEVLKSMVESDVGELEAAIDGLEEDWKKRNGRIYGAFKVLCMTLEDHKAVFAIFPSQSEYTSVLCSSLSCLVKAAKNHSEIAETLSDSIRRISETVARASKNILIFKTQAIRRKLADIYATMFRFYYKTIEWYLNSKLARAFLAFNENLKASFESTERELNRDIEELYREAQISHQAMVAILSGNVERINAELRHQRLHYEMGDTTAGHRMIDLMEASWNGSRFTRRAQQLKPAGHDPIAIKPAPHTQDTTEDVITRAQARVYGPALERFIVGEEGPAKFSAGRFWVAEDEVLPKLQAWMAEGPTSRTLWVSSPYDPAGMTSAQASALAVVAAAWQAKAPLISHFCERPRRDRLRTGMCTEQIGLMGLVYSLVSQLLQFGQADEVLINVGEETLKALDGERGSWDASLKALRVLLDHTSVLKYCVIDGLNDLEFGDGGQWCRQFLNVLLARQRVEGTMFNILLTTAGQSRILTSSIDLKNKYLATRPARELARWGRRIELSSQIAEQEK
ncbi:hypothetical protein F4677DRAFT_443578 [Hypoxylon crocopeplum]|nr:hypothetical protein F4677DRAFT_443578 [Hypoxylon crocopeplum]